MTIRKLYANARLLDPASELDRQGELLAVDGKIAALGPKLGRDGLGPDIETVDCGGAVPCARPGRHARAAARARRRVPGDARDRRPMAAAAGGVTTMVVLPNTAPVIDEPRWSSSWRGARARSG